MFTICSLYTNFYRIGEEGGSDFEYVITFTKYLNSRFYEHLKKFCEICFVRVFAKFKYLVKKFISTESPDHVL